MSGNTVLAVVGMYGDKCAQVVEERRLRDRAEEETLRLRARLTEELRLTTRLSAANKEMGDELAEARSRLSKPAPGAEALERILGYIFMVDGMNKIEAIKAHRLFYPALGLRESKEAVEAYPRFEPTKEV